MASPSSSAGGSGAKKNDGDDDDDVPVMDMFVGNRSFESGGGMSGSGVMMLIVVRKQMIQAGLALLILMMHMLRLQFQSKQLPSRMDSEVLTPLLLILALLLLRLKMLLLCFVCVSSPWILHKVLLKLLMIYLDLDRKALKMMGQMTCLVLLQKCLTTSLALLQKM